MELVREDKEGREDRKASGRVIGIISIKGGVGKSTCAANLGAALASEFGKRVLLVDANFTAPNLGLHFGLTDPEVTIHDVLTNKADVGDAIYEYEKKLHIIPGSLIYTKVNPFKLHGKIKELRGLYDVILIDSSPNLNEEILAAMMASDELIVVTSPDYPTLSCTLNAVKIAKQKNTPIIGLVLNLVRNKSFELSIDEVEDAAGVPVIGYLPDDVSVPESIANTTPAVNFSPNRDISVEYKKLAAAIIGEGYDDNRFMSKLKRFFNREPRKDEVNRDLLREGKLY